MDLAQYRRNFPAPRRVALGALVLVWITGCRFPIGGNANHRSLVKGRQLAHQGMNALERDDAAGAESLLAEAVEASPGDAEVRRQHAESLWRSGKRKEALGEAEEAASLNPDDPMIQVRMAEMKMEMGDVPGGWNNIQAALDLDPKLPAAWITRARGMSRVGNTKQALADYQRALGFDPDNREVLLETAELYRGMNRPARALVCLQCLADTYPPNEEPDRVHELQGLAYMALGRYDDATSRFLAARDQGGASAAILSRLAEAEILAGREEQAKMSLRQALELDPDHPASLALWRRLEVASAPDGVERR